MKKMKPYFYFVVLTSIALCFSWLYETNVKETIIYFPNDETAVYKSAETTLMMKKRRNDEDYKLSWNIQSNLGQKAYLRQDIGLLYQNGRLAGTMGKWAENADKLQQSDIFSDDHTALYEAISFHHSEIHHQDDRILSSQEMSRDYLYIIHSSYSSLRSFRVPDTHEDREWKQLIDRTAKKHLEKTIIEQARKAQLIKEDSVSMFLTELPEYANKPLPGYTMAETKEMTGKLWEGLYKNYFLGIKKRDGTAISPIGSSIPYLIFSRTSGALYILSIAGNGETITLLQRIP